MTSHDWLGDSGEKTGFWLEEFAAPYYAFQGAGVEITVVSPAGGQPPLDPKSDQPQAPTPASSEPAAKALLARLAPLVTLAMPA